MRMRTAPFRFSYRVTYADCTVGNHVYYGRYLEILEAVRGAFFRQLGASFLDWQNQGVVFPVVEVRLRYRGTARYDDDLTVELSVVRAERVRLDFGYRVLGSAEKVLMEGETRHVCASVDDHIQRLPSRLVERLESYLPAEQTLDRTRAGRTPPAPGA